LIGAHTHLAPATRLPPLQPNISAIDMVHLFIYFSEALLLEGGAPTQLRGSTLIMDLDGVSWRNLDPRITRTLFKAVRSKQILCKLQKIMFVNPPFIFNLVYPVLKPFLGDRMVVLGTGAVAREGLLEYIDKGQLLPEYGGTLAYDHEDWVRNCKARAQVQGGQGAGSSTSFDGAV